MDPTGVHLCQLQQEGNQVASSTNIFGPPTPGSRNLDESVSVASDNGDLKTKTGDADSAPSTSVAVKSHVPQVAQTFRQYPALQTQSAGVSNAEMILAALAMCNPVAFANVMKIPQTGNHPVIQSSAKIDEQSSDDDDDVVELAIANRETDRAKQTAFEVNYIGEAFLKATELIVKQDASIDNPHLGNQLPVVMPEKDDNKECEVLEVVQRRKREWEELSDNEKLKQRIVELESGHLKLTAELRNLKEKTSQKISKCEQQVLTLSRNLVKLTEHALQTPVPGLGNQHSAISQLLLQTAGLSGIVGLHSSVSPIALNQSSIPGSPVVGHSATGDLYNVDAYQPIRAKPRRKRQCKNQADSGETSVKPTKFG